MLSTWLTLVLCNGPHTLKLTDLPAEPELASFLWNSVPELQVAKASTFATQQDAARTHLLPNPVLDLSANALPLGARPLDTGNRELPFGAVPNYSIGLSALLELGKRGPRQRAAEALARASQADLQWLFRQRYFDVLESISAVAASQVRINALESMVEGAQKLAQLQQLKASKGEVSSLDAERSLLEQEKLIAQLQAEHVQLTQELRACDQLTGSRCEPFESAGFAERHLTQTVTPAHVLLERRPDIVSLSEQQVAATESESLANGSRLPDPVLRVGYLKDQFVFAGNFPNTLSVGVTLPLPLFDRHQTDALAAQAVAKAASASKERVVISSTSQLIRLAQQLGDVERRSEQITHKILPLAESVVQRLSDAVQRGAAPLQDLLLAQRTLGELRVDRTEVALQRRQLQLAQARLSGTGPTIHSTAFTTDEKELP